MENVAYWDAKMFCRNFKRELGISMAVKLFKWVSISMAG